MQHHPDVKDALYNFMYELEMQKLHPKNAIKQDMYTNAKITSISCKTL